MIYQTSQTDFKEIWRRLLSDRNDSLDVREPVREILEQVRREGDKALIAYTSRFDKNDLTPETLKLDKITIEKALSQVEEPVREAIDLAHTRIFTAHEKQKPKDIYFTDSLGVDLTWVSKPLDSVGLYVPGGTASYPSSVLMNGIPARVAGVKRVVMVVPAPFGRLNPAVLYAAQKIAVDEIYCVGGAQAVAALAYGTTTIKPVDKIVGPGNAYVAEAKRQVYGHVGIDMIAGPSEVLIIADETASPQYIAADLLAQAEHDAKAQAILLTPSIEIAYAVQDALKTQLQTLPRARIAERALERHGAIIVTKDLEEAAMLANVMAAEHVELHLENPRAFADGLRHAGAIFLGHFTPEAIGDYNGGSNHVLPTGRSARFSSGLSVTDFMKRTSILYVPEGALKRIGGDAATFARAEDLEGHARSIEIRLNGQEETPLSKPSQ